MKNCQEACFLLPRCMQAHTLLARISSALASTFARESTGNHLGDLRLPVGDAPVVPKGAVAGSERSCLDHRAKMILTQMLAKALTAIR